MADESVHASLVDYDYMRECVNQHTYTRHTFSMCDVVKRIQLTLDVFGFEFGWVIKVDISS